MCHEEEGQKLLTAREVALRLHLSEGRITQLIRGKKLHGKRGVSGRKWLIPESEVNRLLGIPAPEPPSDPGPFRHVREDSAVAHVRKLREFAQEFRAQLALPSPENAGR